RRPFATADTLLHQLTRLQHLERHKTIERGERCFPQVGGDSIYLGESGTPQMFHSGHKLRSLYLLPSIEMLTRLSCDSPIQMDVEHAFKLLGVLLLQQGASCLSGALNAVSGFFIHLADVRRTAC